MKMIRSIVFLTILTSAGCGVFDPQHHLEKWVAAEKRTLPRSAGKHVRYVDIKAGDMELLFYYDIHGVTDQQAQQRKNQFEQRILQDLRTNTDKYQQAVDYKIRLTHIYRNQNGRELFRFEVEPWELK